MARKKSEPKKGSIEFRSLNEQKINFKRKKFNFNKKQQNLLNQILNPEIKIIFISGPAGTSKTYMGLYGLLNILQEDFDKDLIYIRSIAESADKGLGSLPGDITEKFDPFLMPLYDKLDEILQAGDKAFLKSQEKISAAPINYLRGASWQNKLIFADEAQNFTLKELTTLITRIGEGSKIIIGGDYLQSDINGKSGLKEMMQKFSDEESVKNGILTFSFTEEDIVRSHILKFIINRLEKK